MENKNTTLEKLHRLILKMPGFLEKIVAAILLIAVVYSCGRLLVEVFNVSTGSIDTYIDTIMVMAFNVIIVIEFIRMLIKHSMNTIIEVLIFAIARGLVVGHEEPLQALIRIFTIAILLACRKYLFHDFDFEEEE